MRPTFQILFWLTLCLCMLSCHQKSKTNEDLNRVSIDTIIDSLYIKHQAYLKRKKERELLKTKMEQEREQKLAHLRQTPGYRPADSIAEYFHPCHLKTKHERKFIQTSKNDEIVLIYKLQCLKNKTIKEEFIDDWGIGYTISNDYTSIIEIIKDKDTILTKELDRETFKDLLQMEGDNFIIHSIDFEYFDKSNELLIFNYLFASVNSSIDGGDDFFEIKLEFDLLGTIKNTDIKYWGNYK